MTFNQNILSVATNLETKRVIWIIHVTICESPHVGSWLCWIGRWNHGFSAIALRTEMATRLLKPIALISKIGSAVTYKCNATNLGTHFLWKVMLCTKNLAIINPAMKKQIKTLQWSKHLRENVWVRYWYFGLLRLPDCHDELGVERKVFGEQILLALPGRKFGCHCARSWYRIPGSTQKGHLPMSIQDPWTTSPKQLELHSLYPSV